MALRDRLPMLLEMRKEHLLTLQTNAADLTKDRTGTGTASLQGTLRFIGVAEFVVNGDRDAFRQCLATAAQHKLRLFERHSQGEPIDFSYLTMLAYKDVFDALASGDKATAKEIAIRMGGCPDLADKYDHAFDRCLGYTLKSFVMDIPDQMAYWSAEFALACRVPDNADFAGYATVFGGILQREPDIVQAGLVEIANGHRILAKRGGVFHDTIDEVICVWGIGMANLARSQGLPIVAVNPLIPSELLL